MAWQEEAEDTEDWYNDWYWDWHYEEEEEEEEEEDDGDGDGDGHATASSSNRWPQHSANVKKRPGLQGF